jgi:hypothetical protein
MPHTGATCARRASLSPRRGTGYDHVTAGPNLVMAALILARLPTPEEIAIEVRHRAIGAVLVDICLDLGIMPELLTFLNRRESKFRRELRQRRGDPVSFLTGTPGFLLIP